MSGWPKDYTLSATVHCATALHCTVPLQRTVPLWGLWPQAQLLNTAAFCWLNRIKASNITCRLVAHKGLGLIYVRQLRGSLWFGTLKLQASWQFTRSLIFHLGSEIEITRIYIYRPIIFHVVYQNLGHICEGSGSVVAHQDLGFM